MPPPHPLAMGAQWSARQAGRRPAPPPPEGGGKSSTAVKLGTLGVLSVLLVGFCAAQDDYEEVGADCVDTSTRNPDGSYLVVDDYYCDDDDDHRHYSGSHGAYRWYYGGSRTGARVHNGTTVRPADARITSHTGRVIQRGGFGFHSGGGG
ncbi:hypothetical protein Mam01_20880 [Microbispora amethystogenes]|uniref:Uncharacterized protein n=2 Tax=Microbispora amethystogenes TaxID=1427754 RepID=A0ABQ4FAS4_9ACTN|nr:hypothetical protein Mam01_20880 [Microbispora amethystogenes]